MADDKQQKFNPRRTAQRLSLVFAASFVAVFGFLFQQMWTHSRGFDVYAFEYWGPRAFGVVVVTTILGLAVANRSWKARFLFGFIGGLFITFFYIWIAN
jgi:hypothetical protein